MGDCNNIRGDKRMLENCQSAILIVDPASFPSDTLSTHQVQVKGGAELKRWGLLDKVLASNCPPARQVSLNVCSLTLRGRFPPLNDVDAMISPRRIILDKILVEAAVESGAELRQDLLVEDLILEDGRVGGIRARVKSSTAGSGAPVDEKARLVASKVRASEYHIKPVLTCADYTYWGGLGLEGGEMYSLPRGAVGVWPTNDGLAMIYTAYPIGEVQVVRGHIEGRFWRPVESLPGLLQRVRKGCQAE